MNEVMEMRGELTLVLSDRDGNIVHQQHCKNRIVTSGRRLVAQLFSGSVAGGPANPVTKIGVGTDATAPADGDTALKSQRGNRMPVTFTDPVTYRDLSTGGPIQPGPGGGALVPAPRPIERVRVTMQAVFDFGDANDASVPLREAAIFTDNDVMYNRVVFEEVTKTEAFKLTLLWDVVF